MTETDKLYEDLMNAAQDDGYNARMDGKPQSANPWPADDRDLNSAWDAGWLQASQAIRELRFSDHYHG